jgi:hypothetical protein
MASPRDAAEDEDVDAISAAVSGMQNASSWLNGAAQNIATSGGAPDPEDAVVAYVEAPLAYAANARVVDASVETTRSLFDAFA